MIFESSTTLFREALKNIIADNFANKLSSDVYFASFKEAEEFTIVVTTSDEEIDLEMLTGFRNKLLRTFSINEESIVKEKRLLSQDSSLIDKLHEYVEDVDCRDSDVKVPMDWARKLLDPGIGFKYKHTIRWKV